MRTKKMRSYLKYSSPIILTCIGAAGVIGTAFMSARVTPKALELIKADSCRNHDGDPYAYTKAEAIQSAWKCYIPSILIGASTIACIFGANALNKRQQASMASAYALVSRSYAEYRAKLKELYGEEAHQRVVDSVAVEKSRDTYTYATGALESWSLDFDDRDPNDLRLFYDSFSKRYFESTKDRVLQAEYHLNRNFSLMGYISVNAFYELLGLTGIKGGETIGWDMGDEIIWIDFDHHNVTMEDGLECYVVDMVFEPETMRFY